MCRLGLMRFPGNDWVVDPVKKETTEFRWKMGARTATERLTACVQMEERRVVCHPSHARN